VSASLRSPRAKVERAYEHLHVLDAETAAFYEGTAAEGKPFVVESEFRPDSSEYVFSIEVEREPPLRLGLLLGDFAHNLRSALDHLVCQLALLNGESDCSTTQFPICPTPSRFKELAGNWLQGISARHRAAIEKTQPYESRKPEDHALAILDWVDRIDKHRAVHPAFGFMVDPGEVGAGALRFQPNADAGVIRQREIANGRRIEGKTKIAILKLAPLGPDPKVQMHGHLSFQPAFGERWLSGRALEPVANYVAWVIESFAPDFS
jgi:hypothetical protein